jgi:hypothetical protein
VWERHREIRVSSSLSQKLIFFFFFANIPCFLVEVRIFETIEKQTPNPPPPDVERGMQTARGEDEHLQRIAAIVGIDYTVAELRRPLGPVIAPASAPSDSAGITKISTRLRDPFGPDSFGLEWALSGSRESYSVDHSRHPRPSWNLGTGLVARGQVVISGKRAGGEKPSRNQKTGRKHLDGNSPRGIATNTDEDTNAHAQSWQKEPEDQMGEAQSR